MTTELVKRLEELKSRATMAPWEIYEDRWKAWTGKDVRSSLVRTAWEHGQAKGKVPVIGVSFRATEEGYRDSAFLSADDAALICELVNNLSTILAALSTAPEGMVLVPRRPTDAMVHAGAAKLGIPWPITESAPWQPRAVWSAMIAAAPTTDKEG